MTSALRLMFSYAGTDVRLDAVQPIEIRPLPSDPVQGYEGQTGFWYELRDGQGSTLYRRVGPDPLRLDVEAFSEEPGHRIARREVAAPSGGFVLLVPDLDQARTLALFGSPGEPGAAGEPARLIAQFDLEQDTDG